MIIPQLVAHRGYARDYPENTQLALEAAISAGAQFVEVDVQLTADRVPVLFHDRTLERMCNRKGAIHEYPLSDLSEYRASEFGRFGYKFVDNPITTLFGLVGLLHRHPRVTAFVELKRLSIEQFGVDTVLNRIQPLLAPVAARCVLISYDHHALLRAKERGWPVVGAVIDEWSERKQAIITNLNPRYLFCDKEGLPKRGKLKYFSSQLVVFEVDEIELAMSLASRGVQFIETFSVGAMLEALGLCAE